MSLDVSDIEYEAVYDYVSIEVDKPRLQHIIQSMKAELEKVADFKPYINIYIYPVNDRVLPVRVIQCKSIEDIENMLPIIAAVRQVRYNMLALKLSSRISNSESFGYPHEYYKEMYENTKVDNVGRCCVIYPADIFTTDKGISVRSDEPVDDILVSSE